METDNNRSEEQQQHETNVLPMAAVTATGQPVGTSEVPKDKYNNRLPKLVLLVVIVALALVWSWWLFGRSTSYDENKAINTSEYQAIFLTNGQVYFGKLASLNHKYVTLTNIYYLQVQQKDGSLQNASGNTDSSQVSLAKLGSELHGPEDKMSVSSDQVLFWENLKGDSKVVKAIDAYQNK